MKTAKHFNHKQIALHTVATHDKTVCYGQLLGTP